MARARRHDDYDDDDDDDDDVMMMISTWSQLTPSVLVVGLVAAITKSLAASQLHCWIIM